MRTTLIIIFCLTLCGANAQLRSSLFWNQYALINPAISGIEYKHFGLASYREERGGIYKTASANYNTVIKSRHGVGLNYQYGDLRYDDYHFANLNYNYQLNFDNDHHSKLSIGVAPGYIRYNYNYELYIFDYQTGDILPIEKIDQDRFNLNAGIAYKDDRFLFGLGVRHLYTSGRGIYFDYERNYNLIGRYQKKVSRNYMLELEVLCQSNLNFVDLDWSIHMRYKDKLTYGVNMRNLNTFGAHVQYDIAERVRVGYSFEYYHIGISNYVNPAHQVVLGYSVK